MNINLSADQEKSLEESRKAFNRFTGLRYTTQQYLTFIVTEGIRQEAQAAALAQSFTIAEGVSLNVH